MKYSMVLHLCQTYIILLLEMTNMATMLNFKVIRDILDNRKLYLM